MSTAEDVFYLYDTTTNTIGDIYAPCELKVKCYVNPGEECPVCFDKIIQRTNAFVTNCGHAFHKKCLFKYIELKWKSQHYMVSAKCPICRCSLGHPIFKEKYKSNYFVSSYKEDNELDKLEDFWLTCEYRLPTYCCNQHDHYLGMNDDCFCCKEYREKG